MKVRVTLRDIVGCLREMYCDTIRVKYMHMGSMEQYNWICKRVNHPDFLRCNTKKRVHVFERLCFTNTQKNFFVGKFITLKRFGLDGGETIALALKGAIDNANKLLRHWGAAHQEAELAGKHSEEADGDNIQPVPRDAIQHGLPHEGEGGPE